jgi:hypothetical protein
LKPRLHIKTPDLPAQRPHAATYDHSRRTTTHQGRTS